MPSTTSSLLPVATALLALSTAVPALAAPGDEAPPVITETTTQGPVKVVETTEANGDTTKTVTVGDAEAPVVKVVETTEANGDTTKTVEVVDGDGPVVVVKEDADDDEVVEEVVEEHHHHHHRRAREIKWLGLHAGAVFTPAGGSGRVSSSDGRLRQNQFKACADPTGQTACGYVKGLDLKVQMFETDSAWRYPRFVGYFRTGFEQGRVVVQPGADGFASGQATRLDYTSVPLFLGGSVYLFEEFPVRPYGGLGFGFDVLRLDYRRAQQARVVDASARIGFELHAGLEVRISNYISLNAEVMQLWSARRKLPELPDYSGTGLSVLAGVSVGIPVRLDDRNRDQDHHHTVKRIRRVQ